MKNSTRIVKTEHQANFIALLQALNVTESEVVEKCDGIKGISQSTLNNYLRGATEAPSIDFIRAFCQAFPSVNVNYWLFGKGPKLTQLNARETDLLNDFPQAPSYVKQSATNVVDLLLQNQVEGLKILKKLEKKLL